MSPSWEILIPRDEFDRFSALMGEHGFGGFTASTMGDAYWIICFPPEDVRTLATLKFDIKILPKFGTEVIFTDCPTPNNNIH